MTVNDLCCDRCSKRLFGLADPEEPNIEQFSPNLGIRFMYHPGNLELKDDSGTMCHSCWAKTKQELGDPSISEVCSICQTRLDKTHSFHVVRLGEIKTWRLCNTHAVEFLNKLETVEPKIDPKDFYLPS